MFNLEIQTAEQIAAQELNAAQTAAIHQIRETIEAVAQSFTGEVPVTEIVSWTSKEAAARAVVANTATPEQTAMIEIEAAVTGEASADLAARVIQNADAYSAAQSRLSGLRRKAVTEINAATTPAAVEQAVDDLRMALAPQT